MLWYILDTLLQYMTGKLFQFEKPLGNMQWYFELIYIQVTNNACGSLAVDKQKISEI
jgi:hypothetical protein